MIPQGVKNFERIVNNVGAQLKLPKEDIEGLKLLSVMIILFLEVVREVIGVF